jgi:FkbM family methyltransferase
MRGYLVVLPFSHQLPVILKAYPSYSSNIVALAAEVQKKYPNFAFVDVGANIGDTAILLRSAGSFPIICVEGDTEFFQVLKRNVGSFEDVYIENFFVVGDEEFEGVLVKEGGTAHPSRSKSRENMVKNQAHLSDILQRHKSLASRVKILKIDTDGYDIAILKAQQPLLQALKPVVFFEYIPSLFKQHRADGKALFKQLRSLGYQKMVVYDNFGSYLLTLDLDQEELIEDIDHYFSGRFALPYCDIAVFHEQDVDICLVLRRKELQA